MKIINLKDKTPDFKETIGLIDSSEEIKIIVKYDIKKTATFLVEQKFAFLVATRNRKDKFAAKINISMTTGPAANPMGASTREKKIVF